MSPLAAAILQDMVQSLHATEQFALVTLGPSGSATVVPRANVLYDGQDVFQPDDTPSSQWMRLRVSIILRTRSDAAAEGICRAIELSALASEALLDDPYRGQRCCDLPIGRATEIGHSELVSGLKRPEVEITVAVRCHFEVQEGE